MLSRRGLFSVLAGVLIAKPVITNPAWPIGLHLKAGTFLSDFGSGTTLLLHGVEGVFTEDQIARIASETSRPSVVVNMNVDGVFSEGDLVQTIQRSMIPPLRRLQMRTITSRLEQATEQFAQALEKTSDYIND